MKLVCIVLCLFVRMTGLFMSVGIILFHQSRMQAEIGSIQNDLSNGFHAIQLLDVWLCQLLWNGLGGITNCLSLFILILKRTETYHTNVWFNHKIAYKSMITNECIKNLSWFLMMITVLNLTKIVKNVHFFLTKMIKSEPKFLNLEPAVQFLNSPLATTFGTNLWPSTLLLVVWYASKINNCRLLRYDTAFLAILSLQLQTIIT